MTFWTPWTQTESLRVIESVRVTLTLVDCGTLFEFCVSCLLLLSKRPLVVASRRVLKYPERSIATRSLSWICGECSMNVP